MTISTHRLLLSGLGNVGRSFLEILQSQETLLRERYGVAFRVVGAADSGGAAINDSGLDIAALIDAKQRRASVATLPSVGRAGMSGLELVKTVEADVLLEATPVNLQTGQPGLDTIRAALERGVHAVLANKAPLVLAYQELAQLSDLAGDKKTRRQGDKELSHETAPSLPRSPAPCLRFSACVGGFMPSINMGWRDLRGSRIERLEAVFNGTTQIILGAMESGASYDEGLADAQQRGLAETDPTLDVEGWDAANKLVIFANAVLRQPTTLQDVAVEGITRLSADDLHAASQRGERVVLLCLAEPDGARYRLSVCPTALPLDHPLARMSRDEMGLVFHTDIAGRLSATSLERGPQPTAAAMLRDVLEVVRTKN
jgi:homoserine dehydrogenase